MYKAESIDFVKDRALNSACTQVLLESITSLTVCW